MVDSAGGQALGTKRLDQSGASRSRQAGHRLPDLHDFWNGTSRRGSSARRTSRKWFRGTRNGCGTRRGLVRGLSPGKYKLRLTVSRGTAGRDPGRGGRRCFWRGLDQGQQVLSAPLESAALHQAGNRRIERVRIDAKGTEEPQQIGTRAGGRTGDGIENPGGQGRLLQARRHAGTRRPGMLLHDSNGSRQPIAFALQLATLRIDLSEATVDEGQLIPDRREHDLKIGHGKPPGQDHQSGAPGPQDLHRGQNASGTMARSSRKRAWPQRAQHREVSAAGPERCRARRGRGAGLHGWREV